MASLINGTEIGKTIREEVRQDVLEMKSSVGKVPGLAVVLVGDRKDSQVYVNMKKKACKEAGLYSISEDLSADISERKLIEKIEGLNNNDDIHGILVQLPLPEHINEEHVLSSISLEKDVDGFHPINIGNLAMKGRSPTSIPCTPKGCLELLKRSNVEIAGKNAVVCGRSNIVGIPMGMLLLKENATVTYAHSRTADLPGVVAQADILIAAVGQTEMIKGEWLKPGCVVIDVGINSKPDDTRKKGYRLVGDCEFESCKEVASAITPVPGGVGPMTIAMLLRNTVDAAKRTFGL